MSASNHAVDRVVNFASALFDAETYRRGDPLGSNARRLALWIDLHTTAHAYITRMEKECAFPEEATA